MKIIKWVLREISAVVSSILFIYLLFAVIDYFGKHPYLLFSGPALIMSLVLLSVLFVFLVTIRDILLDWFARAVCVASPIIHWAKKHDHTRILRQLKEQKKY